MTLPTDAEGDKEAHSNLVGGSDGPPGSNRDRGVTADPVQRVARAGKLVHGLHRLAELSLVSPLTWKFRKPVQSVQSSTGLVMVGVLTDEH